MRVLCAAALAIVAGVVLMAPPPQAFAKPTSAVQPVESTAPPTPTATPAPEPPAPKALSADGRLLAEMLMRPLLESLVDDAIPKMGPELLTHLSDWEGWRNWTPRTGRTRADVEAILVETMREAFHAQFDVIIVSVGEELDKSLTPEHLQAINAFFASPSGQSAWDGIITFAIESTDFNGAAKRPPGRGRDRLSFLPPEDLAAWRAFVQTEPGEKFRGLVSMALMAGVQALKDALLANEVAVRNQFNEKACKVAIAPACPMSL